MRRNLRILVTTLLSSLSVAGIATATPLLDAEVPPQAQSQTPQAPQPGSPTAAEPGSQLAENPTSSQPEKGTAGRPATVVLGRREARGVLGREVRSVANENMGRIIDVIVDQVGNARAVVIDFGGFLGVGSRKIAVDWSALYFGMADNDGRVTVEFSRDQVKASPEYQEGKPIFVLSATGDFDRVRVTTSVN